MFSADGEAMMKVSERLRRFAAVAGLILVASLSACKKDSSTPTTPGTTTISLSGTVTQSGAAQAGTDVYLSWSASQKATTGSDGKFSFANLPKANYFVTASRAGFNFSPSNYEVGSASLSRSDLNFSAQAATFGSEVGSVMADFMAKDQKGADISLYNHFGKVILVDFTADWCTDCRAKAETAEQFYQKYKDKGFMYFLIVIEGSAAVWSSQYGLTFPVLDDNSKAIYNIHKKSSIPLPHILDRNMTIRYKKEGWNKAEVEDLLAKYF